MAPPNFRSGKNWRGSRPGKSRDAIDHHTQRTFPTWKAGDVAFLKTSESFNSTDYYDLIKSGYLPSGATCHPVIILESSPDSRYHHVTTISAYSSDEYSNFRPPWQQDIHYAKWACDFRAFDGSVKPNNDYDHLHLADGQMCPKLRTSWVYIQRLYVVPSRVLGTFDKAKQPLRMTQQSLRDLIDHMKAKSKCFKDCHDDEWLQSGNTEIIQNQEASSASPQAAAAAAATTTTSAPAPAPAPAPAKPQSVTVAQSTPTAQSTTTVRPKAVLRPTKHSASKMTTPTPAVNGICRSEIGSQLLEPRSWATVAAA
ncbi:hypothetical protein F5Y15DRAFT_429107 [Xylariaceae sp. FL0016]|nr:hypothetical protein F5Y15DRAFT_429107 [Xylariaceae sp. FL0016]